jgi:Ni2+-binding GTPase involved in maturation of urease and hydrogenase
MKKLNLFLVGGFLGSGKTTGILKAAKQLHKDNKKVGIITNDQGTQQVDTLFIKSHNIRSEEVSGGCFCCNYNDLEKNIESIISTERPDVIFAESVGSCADLVATVINPLITFNPDSYEIVLSVFTDVRLLIKFLQNDNNIFYENVNYIFEKQLEEADIIVVNKIDLLTEQELALAKKIIEPILNSKIIMYQNSLSNESIMEWLTACYAFKNVFIRPSMTIDYNIYGAGETELSWLDEEIGIIAKNNAALTAGYHLIKTIYNKIKAKNLSIGHLKFLIDTGKKQQKISFDSITDRDDINCFDSLENRIVIVINARVQVSPILLREIVRETVIETELSFNCKIIENNLSAFTPGYPTPTHRITA